MTKKILRTACCGMDCLLKIFGTVRFSVATLCVAIKKPIACLKGAKPKDERAHACGMDCLPKICLARKSLGGASVRCYETSIACQKRGPNRTMNAPMAAAWVAIQKMFGPANF